MANPIEVPPPRTTATGHLGRGLWKADTTDGIPIVTNTIRRIGGSDGQRGGRLIAAAAFTLTLLAVGFFAVSLKAQQVYVFNVKDITWVSWVEGLGPDGLLVTFSLMALGLSMQTKGAHAERVLILVSAGLSALMNYAAADSTSWRSILAYTLPVLALAIAVDRLISVVRRWALGDREKEEKSPWQAAGKAARYALRWTLAPVETSVGLRRLVLEATPLPVAATRLAITDGQDEKPVSRVPGESKAACLRRLYEGHPHYGDRSKVGRVAAELAPLVSLAEGSARTTLYKYLDDPARGERR